MIDLVARVEIQKLRRELEERLRLSLSGGLIGAWGPFGLRISGAESGRVGFTGRGIHTDGSITTGLNADAAKPYVRHVASTDTFSEEVGPPPSSAWVNEHWWLKSYTAGDIHAPHYA